MSILRLKVGVIGGFGLMASPMSKHWNRSNNIEVVRVLDRGKTGERHNKIRSAWQSSGAKLVDSIESLFGSGDLDGFFVCVGKNGDDLPILRDLATFSDQKSQNSKPFICHLSTVSVRFVEKASQFFLSKGIPYANFPLTGGPLGAENASMLILCSGGRELFDLLEPSLQSIGKPKYFGIRPSAATEVKLMGHMMVFNGLQGICSAAAVHSMRFQEGRIGGSDQGEFFDFLNSGAGGTRQWEVILSAGIKNDTWDRPFLARYGLLDAIYTAELMIDSGLSDFSTNAIINMAAAFAFLAQKRDAKLATHAILKELFGEPSKELNSWIANIEPALPAVKRLQILISKLTDDLRRSLSLDVSEKSFL